MDDCGRGGPSSLLVEADGPSFSRARMDVSSKERVPPGAPVFSGRRAIESLVEMMFPILENAQSIHSFRRLNLDRFRHLGADQFTDIARVACDIARDRCQQSGLSRAAFQLLDAYAADFIGVAALRSGPVSCVHESVREHIGGQNVFVLGDS